MAHQKKIAVIGGGIAGLSAAYFLSNKDVTLFESSSQLGGLGTFFKHRDSYLEKFYHCMLPSDEHLLELLGKLGILKQVYWKESEFAVLSQNKLYRLNSPLDLLRFELLGFIDRLRVGAVGAYASICSSTGLDDLSTKDWLVKLSGSRAFEVFWRPMLEAKFGSHYDEVPALWFWTRFNREKGAKKEVKGYIQGGYKRIIDSLEEALLSSGAKIKRNSSVDSLTLNEAGKPCLVSNAESFEFDQVVLATPYSILAELLADPSFKTYCSNLSPDIDSQGVINLVLLMKKSVTPYYWTAAVEKYVPFQGIIESSNLLNLKDTNGCHLIYLMNYLHHTDKEFQKSDADIAEEYISSLLSLFPEIQHEDILESFVFRAAHVEPLYTKGYLQKKPPDVIVPGRVFLATSAQVYPEVTSWNSSVGLAEKIASSMNEEL